MSDTSPLVDGGADSVLMALADPTRRQLLDLVGSLGEATATTLAAHVSVSRQAVVKHLAVLDQAGLVTSRRAGREVRFSVRPETLDATGTRLASLASAWDSRLAKLKQRAEID
ncbi:ArsR/SmtB family transcription factor [Mariniluteicoccus flavus]